MLMRVLILKSLGCVVKKEINANVCFNKRNGNTDREEYFDQLLYNIDIKFKEQMLGWIVLGHCSIDLIRQLQVGYELIIYLSL